MKKMVAMCYCDVCGKEVNSERRFTIQLGYGNWNNDEDHCVIISKDLCAACYDGFCAIAENDEPSTEDIVEKVERRRATEAQKKKAFELLDSGKYTQCQIAEMIGVANGTITNWKQAREKLATVVDTVNYLVQ